MRLQIAILLAFLLCACDSPRRFEGDTVKADLLIVASVIEQYKADTGEYPPSGNQGLLQLRKRGYFNTDKYLKDEWGQHLVYRRTENNFILYSKGKNQIDDLGAGDDMVHEKQET